MFYLVRNLKTCLVFTPDNMYKLSSDKAIIQLLRQKMQGLCFNQYGYIVKVVADKEAYKLPEPENGEQMGEQNNQQSQKKVRQFIIQEPEVDENLIKVYVTFSAICFKAQKNDLVLFKVAIIGQSSIIGYIGPVQVVVPKSLIQGFEYRKDENAFVKKTQEGKQIKIDKGTAVKARCFSYSIQMNDRMKIVAEIPQYLLGFIERER